MENNKTARQILESICRDNTHLLDEPEIKEIEQVLNTLLNSPPPQELFNKIGDLRVYLINDPTDRTLDCLHYLGDDAQLWWAQREKAKNEIREMRDKIEELDEDKNADLIRLLEYKTVNHSRILGALYNINSLK